MCCGQYFYAIKDISVGGQCICYGHAKQCETDKLTGVGLHNMKIGYQWFKVL